MTNIITLLEDAGKAVSRVKAIEMMIADIDGLCGSGIHYAFGKKTGRHSDPTYQAFQSLSERRENLVTAKEKAAVLLDTATIELKRIPDRQLQELLYLRHFKNYKWHEISEHFGAGYSADMLKQRHSRFRRGLQTGADGGERRCQYGA